MRRAPRVVAAIAEAGVARTVLIALRLPAEPARFAPGATGPQAELELGFDGAS